MLTVTWLHLAHCAEGQAEDIAEQNGHQGHPDQRQKAGVPQTQSVQSEDGHRIGQAHLHAGHRDGQGEQGLQVTEYHSQSD